MNGAKNIACGVDINDGVVNLSFKAGVNDGAVCKLLIVSKI